MKKLCTILLLTLSIFSTSSALAWRHGGSIGYGYGQEIDASYINTGVFLHGILWRFNKIDRYLVFTINASAGFWKAHTVAPNCMNTFALSPNFRAYFFDPTQHRIRPYLTASFGPTYLSAKQFGIEVQGSHFAFQTALGGGVEIGSLHRAVDITILFIHFCNAGLFHPNDGSDIPLVFNIGFLF